MLTYNIQGRVGELTERTRWNKFEFNLAMTTCIVFSDKNSKEPLKILNEDEVHYTKLVWMPKTTNGNEGSSADDNVNNDTLPTNFAEQMNESSLSQGSLTRQRSRDNCEQGLKVTLVTVADDIVDIVYKKRRIN